MRLLSLPLFILCAALNQVHAQSASEINKWQARSKKVTIIRDNFGVPHIYGKTDADAVFGLMYAQCEDDFQRIELNYLEKLGRLAELKGESFIYNDLYIRLVIDSADAVRDYHQSPAWLKKLLVAFADGINFYLYKHPEEKPAVLKRFEPWFPLLWTDGSIGAISTGYLTATHLKQYYESGQQLVLAPAQPFKEISSGSNGFAISGKNSATGNAMLYINPHVDFYFRPEVHMVSDEGLNAYGAVTWGQFFIYQGFNQYNGWMHTSSDVDVSDLYAESIQKKNGQLFYKYDQTLRPLIQKDITIRYTRDGVLREKKLPALFTHHGPVMSKIKDALISVRSNNRSMKGLIQSWSRTKTRGFEDYKKNMGLLSNTSNNTVYADHKGNIAYWHGNFIPVRDKHYDWAKPVDGSTSLTEWKGLHSVDQSVHIYNPPNGWIQNCNSTPFTVAGPYSPIAKNYPRYMAPDGENFRGLNAVRVFSNLRKPSLEQLINAGYDRRLLFFEKMVPALVTAFDSMAKKDPKYQSLAEPVRFIKEWDQKASEHSVGMHLAIEWATLLAPKMIFRKDEDDYQYKDQEKRVLRFLATASAADLLDPLAAVIATLEKNLGNWQVAWGEVNRFQRISSTVELSYSDDSLSIPVAFASSAWGMLPSYATKRFPGTVKRYGVHGNSFVCAVEFGPRIRARSLLAGGQSGRKGSAHFRDQAGIYTKGEFKDVYFYKEDVILHQEKTYHPGSE